LLNCYFTNYSGNNQSSNWYNQAQNYNEHKLANINCQNNNQSSDWYTQALNYNEHKLASINYQNNLQSNQSDWYTQALNYNEQKLASINYQNNLQSMQSQILFQNQNHNNFNYYSDCGLSSRQQQNFPQINPMFGNIFNILINFFSFNQG